MSLGLMENESFWIKEKEKEMNDEEMPGRDEI